MYIINYWISKKSYSTSYVAKFLC